MLQDIRYGLRTLVQRPGFTAVVVLTLALGIGANTAIFSVVDAVLLRPLPFPHPDQLVLIQDDLTGRQITNVGMSVDELRDFQERAGVFDQISAAWPIDVNLTGAERPERMELLAVSPNYFALLGATPQFGRVFGPDEHTPGFADGVVLSDGAWRRFFGADPQVLGKKIRADSDMYTVIGVMPPNFRHPGPTLRDDVDVWAACGFTANPFSPPVRAARILPGAIGRLKPGLTVAQAQVRLDTFVTSLRQQFPNDYPAALGWAVKLTPSQEILVGKIRTTLMLLLAAVGLVLVIGCVNIANLLLARASARQREMAIRLAIGADRGRLVRQLLTESLLLAALGGAVALVLQAWLIKSLLLLMPAHMPLVQNIGFNAGVLAFVMGVTILTGVLFGLVPAWQASQPDLAITMRDGAPSAGVSGRQQRFRSALVVAEFALCLVLMIGAGLLLRSFGRLMDVNPGFDPHQVLLSRIWLPVPNNPDLDPYRPPEKRVAFEKDILRRAQRLPGVTFAALSGGTSVPMIGRKLIFGFTIEEESSMANNLPQAQTASVTADYFRALGTPVIRGRSFADTDDREAPRVAIIDEALAARYWPNTDPIGRRIKQGGRAAATPWMTIVGVVGTIQTDGLDAPAQPHLYMSLLQNPSYALAVYLKTDPDPASLAQPLRQQIQAVDPDLPVFGQEPMEALVAASLAERRFALELVALFGVLALVLAGVGIYGTMAYSVNQRTREIGIRLALGASRGTILRWVLARGLRLTAAGIAVGIAGALALTRLLGSMLFGVETTDPTTYGSLAALLTAVALVACYIPARRATRIDPLVATTTL